MSETSRGEKVAIYAGGAFATAIILWVMAAFIRSEGMLEMLDWKLAVVLVAVVSWHLMSRRRQKQKP